MNINLDKNKKYLLACSFGPDSMALFDILQKEGYNFAVAHVNYKMRGKNSDYEHETLKKITQDQSIDFYDYVVEGTRIKGNFQNKAREIRYRFFAKIQEEYSFDEVLVAHHLDDNVETYLMQKSRKTKVFYLGLKENVIIYGARVCRPLLHYTKEELLNYCKNNDVPYGIDQSNKSRKYLRNRIRQDHIDKMSIDEKKSIIQEMKKRNNENESLISKLESILWTSNIYNLKQIFSLLEKELYGFLYMLFLKHDIPLSYSENKANNIIQILKSSKPNACIKIAEAHYFIKAYDCFFVANQKKKDKFEIIMDKPNLLIFEHLKIDFSKDFGNTNITRNDFPLTIRSFQSKDEYTIANYKKKISRMLVDMKLPLYFRNSWPIFVNKNDKVVYVPRYRENYVKKPADKIEITLKI